MKTHRRRFIRKTIAIAIGLFLGLLAAEVALDQKPTAAAYGASPATSGETKADEKGESHSMEALTLKGGKGPWFGKLVFVTAALFLAAAALGPVVMALKSPEPPERDEMHGQDAYAGKGGHGGHGH